MSEEQQIKQLLREGVEAARAGDKATARDRFQQVTELDENNERAWLYLAQVVETEEERRVCLNNVLVINPDNEKARQAMDRLTSRQRDQQAQDEVVPGISRRQLLLIGGGGALVVVLVLGLFLITSMNRRNQEAAAAQSMTQTMQAMTSEASTAVAQQTADYETQVALVGTETPTPRANVLPTLIPPTETPTATPTPLLLPSPGPEVAGRIVAWGGPDVLSNGALEPRAYVLGGGGEYSVIGNELGRDVRFGGSGDRIIYSRYYSATFDFGLEAININGTQQQAIRATTGLLEAQQPDYCRVGNRVVFVAVPEQRPLGDNIQFDVEPPTQVFIIDLDLIGQGGTPPPNATIRLTNDGARYSYPAFSPDCSQVAVVRDDFNSAQAGADVVVLDVNSIGTVTNVTTDLSTFEESSPRWSADGTQLVFAAAPATNPGNHDIVVANANGSGAPQVPIRHEADDVLPVFSPDGGYIAFSSNRQGAYNIFIYRLSDGEIFQLTNDEDAVFVGGWWQ